MTLPVPDLVDVFFEPAIRAVTRNLTVSAR